MAMVIPKFKDGEVLTEQALYQLGLLSLELQRINNSAKGQFGFFSPDSARVSVWNQFDCGQTHLYVGKLYIISEDGIPIFMPEETEFDLDHLTPEETELFVSLFVATDSRFFSADTLKKIQSDSTEGFDFNTGFDDPVSSVEGAEQSLQNLKNGYTVLLHWSLEGKPSIEGSKSYTVKLGDLDKDSAKFILSPSAYFPQALPGLVDVVKSFSAGLEEYRQVLIQLHSAPGVERSLLLDRLELLATKLNVLFTPSHQLISYAKLLLKAAKGFYLRIAYSLDKLNVAYDSCQALEGRLLEYHLESLYTGVEGDLDQLIKEIEHIAILEPRSADEQIKFFSNLLSLIEPSRHEELFASLIFPAEIARQAQPRIQPPRNREPRRRPKPVGPRIIDLNKDKD